MRRTLLLPLAFFSVVAWGDEAYIGLYMQGQKIGWTSLFTSDMVFEGKAAKKADIRLDVPKPEAVPDAPPADIEDKAATGGSEGRAAS